MKRLFLATAILLLSSSWASTQSSSPSGQAQPDKSQTPASDHKGQSIVGCLSGAANTFTLTDATGKTYELVGDTSGLNKNVGHKVRLSGNVDNSGGGANITASGPQAIFGVKSVKSLSDTCK